MRQPVLNLPYISRESPRSSGPNAMPTYVCVCVCLCMCVCVCVCVVCVCIYVNIRTYVERARGREGRGAQGHTHHFASPRYAGDLPEVAPSIIIRPHRLHTHQRVIGCLHVVEYAHGLGPDRQSAQGHRVSTCHRASSCTLLPTRAPASPTYCNRGVPCAPSHAHASLGATADPRPNPSQPSRLMGMRSGSISALASFHG